LRSPPFSLSASSPARRPLKKLPTPPPTKPLWLKKLLRLLKKLPRLLTLLLLKPLRLLTPLLLKPLRLLKKLRLPSKPYGLPALI
jgi:hypothetical protein